MDYEKEIKMFGRTQDGVELGFASASNINMRLMGMLSDVQMLIDQGSTVEAKQVINQVKYYFSEYTNTRDCIPAQRNIE